VELKSLGNLGRSHVEVTFFTRSLNNFDHILFSSVDVTELALSEPFNVIRPIFFVSVELVNLAKHCCHPLHKICRIVNKI